MSEQGREPRNHINFSGQVQPEPFRYPGGGGANKAVPHQDRQEHGKLLLNKIHELRPMFKVVCTALEEAGIKDGFGLQVEFESFPEIQLAFESLAQERSGIELLNVRQSDDLTHATIFIPDGKLHLFENRIHAYMDEENDNDKGEPKHSRLLNTIADIRAATLEALWTDDEPLPSDDTKQFWWEAWLPSRFGQEKSRPRFVQFAMEQGMQVATGEVHFPERIVLLAYGSINQVKGSMLVLNSVAELRRARETAEFFDALPQDEQAEWLDELRERTTWKSEYTKVPHICLLDTGVNHGHPLINPALSDQDLHTVNPGWGTDDKDGHGTAMAGIALYGNLTDVLDSNIPIKIDHRLESVKLLNKEGGNHGDDIHYGYLTAEAVSRPEVNQPDRQRVFNLTITAQDQNSRGIASAWSAALDQLAFDADGIGESPRLFMVSAGNLNDSNDWENYPSSNATAPIEDPGQSWNSLTVGAATDLVTITDSDANCYHTIANQGGLSPFSTTSVTWEQYSPIKPDVVLEGGNAAKDDISASGMTDLSLLTTSHTPADRLFTTTNGTSASATLASRMAAQLMAEYPDLWPETIRALIVHSADWTDDMKQMFLNSVSQPTKSEMTHLVRHCGFGVPDLDRALWSLSNSLTLICEDSLTPFMREGTKQPKTNQMNLHKLPWPLAELEALGEIEVTMKVTLSYFIEPNPSRRGRSRYRYESHGLRFDVKRPEESVDEFKARVNKLARDENNYTGSGSSDSQWLIGATNRTRGSLHADIWKGTAADLASRGILCVYPMTGWWKTRTKLGKYDSKARYCLLVSIHAPEVSVDLYSAVVNQIATPAVVTIDSS